MTAASIEQSKILALRITSVRPFADQPRTDFDFARLNDLADSIVEFGQQVPIIVRALPDPQHVDGNLVEFEVIDGERRLKACSIAGLKVVRAVVGGARDSDHQFMQSVVANFGREEHTAAETIKAVARVCAMPEYAALHTQERHRRVGALFARSADWAETQLRLWSLPDEVLAMMSGPKERRLSGQVAQFLTRVPDSAEQVALATRIVDARLKHPAACTLIRNTLKSMNVVPKRGSRRPSEDGRSFERCIGAIHAKAKAVLDMPMQDIKRALAAKSSQDRSLVLRRLDKAIEELGAIRQAVAI